MPVLHTVANTKSFSRGSQTHFGCSCSDQNAQKVKSCHFYCGHISAVFTMLSSAVFRYKPLCPDTWPNWKGTAAEGVRRLIKHLGYKSDEYKMGRYADINGWVTQTSSSKSFSTEALLNKEKSSNLDRHSAFVLPVDKNAKGPSKNFSMLLSLKDKNLHPPPENPVRNRRCLSGFQTQAW